MRTFKFHLDQLVSYDNSVMKGKGVVCGYATTEMPVMGSMVIIRDTKNLPTNDYPFDTFVVAECHLKPANA